jgi:prolyl-tRNA editing enzyme YbaK/EbsC (Cys-tRNA(Pro) deacylase)
MAGEWSPSVRRVQEEILARGLAFEILELKASTRTAQEAAQAVGCQVAQIVKSLIFKGAHSGEPILILASGSNRVNEKKVGEIIGEPIGKADADFVKEKTGFSIGGVPPLAHRERLRTYIDETLLGHPCLWAAAGTPNAVFRLTPSDLLRITEGRVISIQ